MHQPGVPEDLKPLDQVWARAVLLYLVDEASDFLFDDDEVSCPCGGAGN